MGTSIAKIGRRDREGSITYTPSQLPITAAGERKMRRLEAPGRNARKLTCYPVPPPAVATVERSKLDAKAKHALIMNNSRRCIHFEIATNESPAARKGRGPQTAPNMLPPRTIT